MLILSKLLFLKFPRFSKGSVVLVKHLRETIVGSLVMPARTVPKDPSKWNDSENEKVALNTHLPFIITDSMDLSMFGSILSYKTTKEMWERILVICEGTEEVRENMTQSLISEYEVFMAQPKGEIKDISERFNKLINELRLNEKFYTTKELNMKFLLTVPNHPELIVNSLRDKDFIKISYDVLFGVLKTHEPELL